MDHCSGSLERVSLTLERESSPYFDPNALRQYRSRTARVTALSRSRLLRPRPRRPPPVKRRSVSPKRQGQTRLPRKHEHEHMSMSKSMRIEDCNADGGNVPSGKCPGHFHQNGTLRQTVRDLFSQWCYQLSDYRDTAVDPKRTFRRRYVNATRWPNASSLLGPAGGRFLALPRSTSYRFPMDSCR